MTDPDAIENVSLPERRQRVHGHGTVRAVILHQLAQRCLPGAVLFHGPQGIGKATFAFEMAAAIFAATGDEDARRIEEQVAALSHPNLFLLRRRPKDTKGFYSVIRVEDVRGLRDRLHHTRGRAGHRVAIIDSIDDCNASAANALLKTLEEPPAETVFLLVSHRPGQLLPTIKSRCHSLALRPVSDADIRRILTEHDPVISVATLERAIALAGGRPRRAFETLALNAGSALEELQAWLGDPVTHSAGMTMRLADALGVDPQSSELLFAREIIADWLADEAREAAIQSEQRMRLASASELWDKVHALFAESDSINLDMKQTLAVIFDAIRNHVSRTVSVEH